MSPTSPQRPSHRLSRRRSHDARPQPSRRHSRGGTLLGVFIGLIIGLGMAAGVAFWLMRNNPAFQTQNVREPSKDAAKVAKAEADKPRFDFYKILPGEDAKVQPAAKAPERPDRNMAEQAKERQAPGRAPERTAEASSPAPPASSTTPARAPEKVAMAEPPAKAVKGERFWLQAGSFAGEPEAENLKARLALGGWEATVQQGMMPDKAVRYRVRLGPYDNPDEIARMKSELGKRGFDVAVIKF